MAPTCLNVLQIDDLQPSFQLSVRTATNELGVDDSGSPANRHWQNPPTFSGARPARAGSVRLPLTTAVDSARNEPSALDRSEEVSFIGVDSHRHRIRRRADACMIGGGALTCTIGGGTSGARSMKYKPGTMHRSRTNTTARRRLIRRTDCVVRSGRRRRLRARFVTLVVVIISSWRRRGGFRSSPAMAVDLRFHTLVFLLRLGPFFGIVRRNDEIFTAFLAFTVFPFDRSGTL